MGNFFRDNKDLNWLLKNIDLSEVIFYKEKNFEDAFKYDYAPSNVEDAVEDYKIALDILGEICADRIAPMSKEVDKKGATFKNGKVEYAEGTKKSLKLLSQAQLMGFTLPRKYGGLNFPKTIYSMAIEMISRADGSLMNLFGLQDIAETIYKFGNENQKERYLPKFSSGEVTGAMALTEPDAGSDLQSVSLRAEERNGKWYLNGVKRFITNGCGDVLLVLARSEPNTTGGRGLSLFIYEKDENLKIRRIEEKLGIHGSPTCELQFNDAPCELLGERKLGLVKYTMSLMNGARLAVAAQAIGISEAAFREALDYARSRVQFGKPIIEFPQVYEMLSKMKIFIEAGRRLICETSKVVDLKEGLEEYVSCFPNEAQKFKKKIRDYSKWSGILTPFSKIFCCEAANKICYDAIQVLGGVGYTKDFSVERYYRDVRVTTIYEGTTQLQVLGAIGGVLSGSLFNLLDKYEKETHIKDSELFSEISKYRSDLEKAVKFVKEKKDQKFQQFHANRIVNMGIYTLVSYLVCLDALVDSEKDKMARAFMSFAEREIRGDLNFILTKSLKSLKTL